MEEMNGLAFLTRTVFFMISFSFALGSPGQQIPVAMDHEECGYRSHWDEYLSDPKLAKVLGPGDPDFVYTWNGSSWSCSPERGDCARGGFVRAGLPVIAYEVRGDWTCIWYEDYRKGAAHGWMRTDHLRTITYDTNPPQSAWLGNWRLLGSRPRPKERGTAENDRLVIGKSQQAGGLRVAGNAYWDAELGGHSVVRSAHIHGVGTAHRNNLQVGEGDCEVKLKLIGNYLLTTDNDGCGGLNARFQGIWER
jgi:hypothetical protein